MEKLYNFLLKQLNYCEGKTWDEHTKIEIFFIIVFLLCEHVRKKMNKYY